MHNITPLVHAIRHGHIEAVRLLLDNGASVYYVLLRSNVIIDCCDDIFKLLMDYGCDSIYINSDASTQTSYNTMHPRVIELILNCLSYNHEQDCYMNREDAVHHHLYTSIHWGAIESIDITLIYGANINICSNEIEIRTETSVGSTKSIKMKLTPLQYAICIKKDADVLVKALIDRGADKTIKNSNGLNARDIAILVQRFDLIDMVS
jgi:ankyrin repeat protein